MGSRKISMKLPMSLMTADVVVFHFDKVLAVRRKFEPCQGELALPGGLVELNETIVHAAQRELEEETGLKVRQEELHFVHYFDGPGRDSRNRTVTFAFYIELDHDRVKDVCAGDDAADAVWVNPTDITAFDHYIIVREAIYVRGEEQTRQAN